MKILRPFGHLMLCAILTGLTQVGGIIWLLVLLLSKIFNWKKRLIFPLLYLAFNLLLVPVVAKQFGRTRLPVFSENIKPINWFYPLTFRNYVTPELKSILLKASKESNQNITYLDANFPFIDGFPLLPHLSHNDGKKVDIAFQYKTKSGEATNKKPSGSGYGIFVNPEDNKTTNYCKSKGSWQYDFTKYLSFGKWHDLDLESIKTKALLLSILNQQELQKLFIEPHLKQHLGLSKYSKIRFQGCQAVRHDDHIHLQI